MWEQIGEKYTPKFKGVIEHGRKELAKMSIGRAKPSLVEDVVVEAYGSHLKLRELANISAPEPNMLLVKVWDQNIIREVEKALLKPNQGLQAGREGDIIRVKLPELTQERREELVKFLHQVLERQRIAIRNLRDKAREEIQKLERAGQISEDEKFRSLEELDEETREYILEVETLGEEKEREIRGG